MSTPTLDTPVAIAGRRAPTTREEAVIDLATGPRPPQFDDAELAARSEEFERLPASKII